MTIYIHMIRKKDIGKLKQNKCSRHQHRYRNLGLDITCHMCHITNFKDTIILCHMCHITYFKNTIMLCHMCHITYFKIQ